jgi:DNA polymerase-3 subunit epsilon
MIDLIFDTETTGIKAPDFTPEIVQIAAILQNRETRRVYHEFCMMVTPKSIIPETVAEIHGITTEMARDHGFSQAEAEGLFIMLLADADRLVAHNIAFDVEMLKDNWPDASALAMEKEHYDTMHELTPVMKLPKNRREPLTTTTNTRTLKRRACRKHTYTFSALSSLTPTMP